MLKNYQKLEFNLGHLGTGGKLYFIEHLQKKIQKIKPLTIQAVKKVVQNPPLWSV